MAKQIGLLKYSGTMGGVRHFKIKGLDGDFAGMAGGPTAQQVLNDPAFERTRENMSEFGGSASAGKALRMGLSQIIQQFSDGQLTGRLTAIMKQINLDDITSPRGQRKIKISTSRNHLKGLDFNQNISFSSFFNAPFTLVGKAARDGATFTIPPFNPNQLINAPAGTTHFRLLNACSIVSDWGYNPTSGNYEPTDPNLNKKSNIAYSPYLSLTGTTANTIITTTIADATPMTATVSVLNCIGIEFYQKIGTNYYLFNTGSALRIDNLF